jgi:hypothetical protein
MNVDFGIQGVHKSSSVFGWSYLRNGRRYIQGN